jgi:MFS family permease
MVSSEPAPLPKATATTTAQSTVSIAHFLQIFSAVMLPMFLAAADQTLLATATPSIAADLGGLRDTTWVSVAYLIAMTATVPLYGRLGDRLGRRDTLIAALGVFCLGSVACGLAASLPWLVAARVVQGLGGGGLMVMSQSLIRELVPPRERARFQGYFATNFTLANVGGPVIGGLVLHHASWRCLFLANLPLCALALWRLSRLPRGHGDARVMMSDLPGAAAFVTAVTISLAWASFVDYRFTLTSGASIALAAGGVALWAALIAREMRHANPFLPIELMRDASMRNLCLMVVSFAACLFALIFFLPVLMQIGHGADARRSGLLLLPMTLGIVTGSTLTGRIVSRTGNPTVMPLAGLSISCLALVLLSVLPPAGASIAALGAICGFGFGTVMPTAQIVSQALAGRERLGAAATLVSLSRYTGAAAGTAIFGAVVFALAPAGHSVQDLQHLSESSRAPLSQAIRIGFGALALVAASGAWFASRVRRIQL